MSTSPGIQSHLLQCQQATCPLLSSPTTIHQKFPIVTDSEDDSDSDMEDLASPDTTLQDQPTESTKTLSTQKEPTPTQREIQDHIRPKPRAAPFCQER